MAYSKVTMVTSEYLSQQLHYSEEKKEIIAYGLEKLIFTILGFLSVIVVGWVLQIWKEALVAVVAGAMLRKYSGGAHRATALGCLVYGAVTYPAAAWLAHFVFYRYGSLGWLPSSIIGLLILAIVQRYAPVDSPAKPIISPEFRKRLYYTSLVIAGAFILVALFLIQTSLSIAILAGLSIQTISLLPILNQRR